MTSKRQVVFGHRWKYTQCVLNVDDDPPYRASRNVLFTDW